MVKVSNVSGCIDNRYRELNKPMDVLSNRIKLCIMIDRFHKKHKNPIDFAYIPKQPQKLVFG